MQFRVKCAARVRDAHPPKSANVHRGVVERVIEVGDSPEVDAANARNRRPSVEASGPWKRGDDLERLFERRLAKAARTWMEDCSGLTGREQRSCDCDSTNKRLVEFAYKDVRTKVVEPHDYGIREGIERLLGFQVSGQARAAHRTG
jgi:hypothetical protein